MITFLEPSLIDGTINIESPDSIVKIQNTFTTPIAMQMVFSSGDYKHTRDIVFMQDHLSICKPDLPKEFIESKEKITCKIAIFIPEDVVYTNELEVKVNIDTYELLIKSGDRIKFLEDEVGELKRLITLAVVGKRIPISLPKDLGQPKPGMVMTVLNDNVYGWSDLFKEVVTQINEIKTINGKVSLLAKDIKLNDGETTVQDLNDKLISATKTFTEVLNLLKENAEALAQFKKEFEEYKNQDVI